jgi:predicted nucleic acid-binding protein
VSSVRERRFLIDTSAWIETLRPLGEAAVRAAVAAATDEGSAVLCDIVLLELWNGAQGEGQKKFLRSLEQLLQRVETSEAVWQRARNLSRRCRAAGMTVPATDLLIAACADHHGLELVHRDTHFDQLARLPGRMDS